VIAVKATSLERPGKRALCLGMGKRGACIRSIWNMLTGADLQRTYSPWRGSGEALKAGYAVSTKTLRAQASHRRGGLWAMREAQ